VNLGHHRRTRVPHGPRIGSLCIPARGLDLAVEPSSADASSGTPRSTGTRCTVLAHRFAGLDNLGDIPTVDWDTVAPVDIVTAGFPARIIRVIGYPR